jgi:hypothetical protein
VDTTRSAVGNPNEAPLPAASEPGSARSSVSSSPAREPDWTTRLAWTNIPAAVSAASLSATIPIALGHRPDISLTALAFCVILHSYIYDRMKSARAAWTAHHVRPLRLVMRAALVVAFILVAYRPVGAFALVGAAMLWAYAKPWIPRDGKRASLRQLTGVKAPYVLVAFIFVCVLPQAAHLGALTSSALWMTAAAGTLVGSAAGILNDMRDTEADRADGTASIPVLLGTRAARLVALAAVCSGGVIGQWSMPLPYLIAALYGAVLTGIYQPRNDARLRLWIEVQAVLPLAVALALGI